MASDLKNSKKNKNLDKYNFAELEKQLDIQFRDKNLLIQAFIHRSYFNENNGLKLGHNERLEFLGDAVLELVSTNFLYHKFPDLPEGQLTSYRAALVNTKSISQVARDLGFNDFLLLSKGESHDSGRARLSILADSYESFLGAIFLDQGYEVVKNFITKTLLIHTEEIIETGGYRDAKSQVQELAQEKLSVTPSYQTLSETGPDHDKVFLIGIYFGDTQIAQGKGRSKQEAETKAAEAAILKRNWNS